MSCPTQIHKVVLAGKGRFGSVVFDELLKAGFTVKVLTRTAFSQDIVPNGVDACQVDYSSEASLQRALEGYHAVVSTVAGPAVLSQKPLINAAISTGIKHFIPADYAMSLNLDEILRLPPYVGVSEIVNYLQQRSNQIEWTVVGCGGFLEYVFDLPLVIDFKNRRLDLVNGGEVGFSVSEFRTVAKAVAGVFKEPRRVKNHCVEVHDMIITQKETFDIIKKYDPKPWAWTVTETDSAAKLKQGRERIANGDLTMDAISSLMAGAVWDPKFQVLYLENDNDWPGIEMARAGKLEEVLRTKTLSGVSDIANDQIIANA